MIGDNIKHDPDAFLVASIHEILKVLLSSKVLIDLLPITSTISVVIFRPFVIGNRRNPDGVEAHTLDVVKFVLNSFESTTASFMNIGASFSATVSSPETIGKQLINRTGTPFFFGTGLCQAKEHSHSERS